MRGLGVSDALYAVVENRARSQGISLLQADASHLAKLFFLRQGWTVVRENQVDMSGTVLANWIMNKSLA